jgi:hypothetical protein
MHARGEDRYRSTIGVVSRVGDELIVKRCRRPLGDVVGIERLENFLLAVIERSFPDEKPEPAGGEKVAMRSIHATLSTGTTLIQATISILRNPGRLI